MIFIDSRREIFEKQFWRPKFGSNGPKLGPKLDIFCHFLKFGSLAFPEIAYNDSSNA